MQFHNNESTLLLLLFAIWSVGVFSRCFITLWGLRKISSLSEEAGEGKGVAIACVRLSSGEGGRGRVNAKPEIYKLG